MNFLFKKPAAPFLIDLDNAPILFIQLLTASAAEDSKTFEALLNLDLPWELPFIYQENEDSRNTGYYPNYLNAGLAYMKDEYSFALAEKVAPYLSRIVREERTSEDQSFQRSKKYLTFTLLERRLEQTFNYLLNTSYINDTHVYRALFIDNFEKLKEQALDLLVHPDYQQRLLGNPLENPNNGWLYKTLKETYLERNEDYEKNIKGFAELIEKLLQLKDGKEDLLLNSIVPFLFQNRSDYNQKHLSYTKNMIMDCIAYGLIDINTVYAHFDQKVITSLTELQQLPSHVATRSVKDYFKLTDEDYEKAMSKKIEIFSEKIVKKENEATVKKIKM